jgi:hypothetical protein
MDQIRKYPRTQHIINSRLQPGDEGFNAVGFEAIEGRHVVVEEKLDGANAAISFDADGNLLLQSRGHYLTGGPAERHFALLKSWANGLRDALWPVLGSRFVVYGEWLYAKHTIFYDALPHYFMEFDILDRETDVFLDTPERRQMLGGLPITPVPVLHEGVVASPAALVAMVGPSLYKSGDWREKLGAAAEIPPHRPEMVMRQTDLSGLAEGLYIKVEEEGRVTGRYKFVRHDFLTRVIDSESHWQSRPILPNQLAQQAEP